jgi:hypothetical protein
VPVAGGRLVAAVPCAPLRRRNRCRTLTLRPSMRRSTGTFRTGA